MLLPIRKCDFFAPYRTSLNLDFYFSTKTIFPFGNVTSTSKIVKPKQMLLFDFSISSGLLPHLRINVENKNKFLKNQLFFVREVAAVFDMFNFDFSVGLISVKSSCGDALHLHKKKHLIFLYL